MALRLGAAFLSKLEHYVDDVAVGGPAIQDVSGELKCDLRDRSIRTKSLGYYFRASTYVAGRRYNTE